MALITLLRHAPLPLEYQKKYIGHSDIRIDDLLTDISKLEVLKKREYDLVFSSDLKRCTQTLDLIDINYVKDTRLREVKFKKEFEQKSFKDIEKFDNFDSSYLTSTKTWHEFICEESFNEYKNRVEEFIKDLPSKKNILICSHAGTIRMLNAIITNNDYENSYLKVEYLDRIEIVL